MSRNSEPVYFCSKCRDVMWLHDEATNTAHPCTCRAERRASALLRQLPKALREMGAENFDTRRLAHPEPAGKLLTVPHRASLLYGLVGVGKTHLLVAKFKMHVAMAPAENILWYDSDKIAGELRIAAFGHEDTPRLFDMLDRERPFHLYWDDVDKLRLTESGDAWLFKLLNGMMLAGCRISATSNLTLEQLSDLWNPALVRRFGEMLDGMIHLEAA